MACDEFITGGADGSLCLWNLSGVAGSEKQKNTTVNKKGTNDVEGKSSVIGEINTYHVFLMFFFVSVCVCVFFVPIVKRM